MATGSSANLYLSRRLDDGGGLSFALPERQQRRCPWEWEWDPSHWWSRRARRRQGSNHSVVALSSFFGGHLCSDRFGLGSLAQSFFFMKQEGCPTDYIRSNKKSLHAELKIKKQKRSRKNKQNYTKLPSH